MKNEVFESKHRLKESLNHCHVNVQEQLTKAMSRAIYRMKEAGIRVSTFESRLLYTNDGKHVVINSLAELPSKLGWDRAKMKKKCLQNSNQQRDFVLMTSKITSKFVF